MKEKHCSKPKHTPEPWRLNLRYGKPFSVYGPDNLAIASWQNVKRSDDEIAANARLIAAAPTLLDLLSRVVKACGVNHLPDLKKECLDAIAKATGG